MIAETLHAIIGHRRRGDPVHARGRAWSGSPTPSTWLRAARGSRWSRGREGIHSISAAAIDEVRIAAGEERPVRIEIELNNSAGIFQVDDLLATKIRGTPLEGMHRGRGRGQRREREAPALGIQASGLGITCGGFAA